MDPRLLRYYNQELRYLREMGAEFAREFPKIAGRLGMEGMEVSDPYVERLIEGCAFLAARVQLKQDAEFPELSQRLIEMISPNLAAPVPSMLVARIQCAKDSNLVNGFRVPRGSALLGSETALSRTRCEFRTAQDVVLTPITVTSAEYFPERCGPQPLDAAPPRTAAQRRADQARASRRPVVSTSSSSDRCASTSAACPTSRFGCTS
jgi:type VI secretion system protein ImpG